MQSWQRGLAQFLAELLHILAQDWEWQQINNDDLQHCTGQQVCYILINYQSCPRTQSCYVGGIGEDNKDELVAEMDDKIRELKAAVSDKDAELEKLKETLKMLQEKITNGVQEKITNEVQKKITNGPQEKITNEVQEKIPNGNVETIATGSDNDDITEETVQNDTNIEDEAAVAEN